VAAPIPTLLLTAKNLASSVSSNVLTGFHSPVTSISRFRESPRRSRCRSFRFHRHLLFLSGGAVRSSGQRMACFRRVLWPGALQKLAPGAQRISGQDKTKARTALLSCLFLFLEHEAGFDHAPDLFGLITERAEHYAGCREIPSINNRYVAAQEKAALLVSGCHGK